VAPNKQDEHFYRNAQGDEVVFVSEGEGTLETQFGNLPFTQGDYLVIHRGILHRYVITKPAKLLIIESRGYVRTPSRYRNDYGQIVEGAPYSERDFRGPETLITHDVRTDHQIIVKQYNGFNEIILDHHPFDVVGWDGMFYPWAFNIKDFEPIVGRVHQPPPVHQTFQGDGFVICSFCPRPFDFHPEAIPAPYNHSNVDSDEVMFYASSEFMSRKGIEYGSITHHPDGIPHGPHPGRAEASMSAKGTDEYAVMMDSFRPLKIATTVSTIEDKAYQTSWLDAMGGGFIPPTS
jgi:homogentisate 1,2-dioxygenase